MPLASMIEDMAKHAKEASRHLRRLERAPKDAALRLMATRLMERQADIIKENKKDLSKSKKAGLSPAMIDRLTLDETVIKGMADGLEEVAVLPDPVGQITGTWKRPNGLLVKRVRIPLGVIGFIYESRPNVTVDAASLCLKSGNAVILKGGSEAISSNLILADLLEGALKESGLPPKAIQVIPSTDREAVSILIGLEDFLDIIIPRGGEGLIRFVTSHSKVPVLKHYKMSSLILKWPKMCVLMPRCKGRGSAMPWRPCSCIRVLLMLFSLTCQNVSVMPAWRSEDVPEQSSLFRGQDRPFRKTGVLNFLT